MVPTRAHISIKGKAICGTNLNPKPGVLLDKNFCHKFLHFFSRCTMTRPAIINKTSHVIDSTLCHLAIKICKIIFDSEVHICVCHIFKHQPVIAQEILHDFGIFSAFSNLSFKAEEANTCFVPAMQKVADFIVQMIDAIVIL